MQGQGIHLARLMYLSRVDFLFLKELRNKYVEKIKEEDKKSIRKLCQDNRRRFKQITRRHSGVRVGIMGYEGKARRREGPWERFKELYEERFFEDRVDFLSKEAHRLGCGKKRGV